MDRDNKTTIFLIRHGQSEINMLRPRRIGGMKSNAQLTPTGIEQAKLTSELVREFTFHAFYSSPLDRALKTAEIIAAPHGKPVKKIRGFIENDCGSWEGMSYDEIMKNDREYYDKWMADSAVVPFPEGENYQQVLDRAFAALDEIIKRHPGETVVVVSHNAVLKVLIAHALGLPISKCRSIKTSNLGITVLESKNGRFSVRTLNSIFHLRRF